MDRRSRFSKGLTDNVRELALFAVAIGGVIYETVIVHVDRPYLLGLFGAMLGIPAVTQRDRELKRKRRQHDDQGDDDDE